MNLPGTQLPQSVAQPYTGGHTVVFDHYVWELCPDHPKANTFGFVQQHRLVVERSMGKFLAHGLQVHHRNEDKTDNRLENLEVLTRSEHMKKHRQMRWNYGQPMIREAVEQALSQGGLKAAARILKCCPDTIRNRFPDLVAPYKRRSPTRIDDPVAIAKVLAVAANDKKGYRDVSRETGISYRTCQRICERNGIPWTPKWHARPGRPRKKST